MKHRILVLLNAVLIAAFTAYFNASTFPLVGADYKYFLPRLIDTELHYRLNGLSIQWYTPSFAGGLPAYPHPQNMQFSPVQALTAIFDPWTATQINYFVFVFAGFLGAYYFFKRILAFNWQASTLGAVFFCANGFYLQHTAAGHLNHQGFPLLPFLLIGLLDVSLSPLAGGILLSVVFALLIYSASFYPLIYILLSLGILLPFAYLLRPAAFDWKRIALSALWGLLFTFGLTGSKLYAVEAFMRFFPREVFDIYNIPLRTALEGFALQFSGVMALAPVYWLAGLKMTAIRDLLQAYTGAYVGLWELDLSISPILWPMLAAGVVLVFLALKRKGWPKAKSFWLAVILFLFASELAAEFALARGIFYPFLRNLPILRSLHINTRFGAAFLFPLAMAGAAATHYLLANLSKLGIQRGVFVSLNVLAIIPLGAYLLLPVGTLQRRIFDTSDLIENYHQMQAGATFPIERISSDANDARVFSENASSLNTQEMIFGYSLGKFKSDLHDGPVTDEANGAFNLTNPTGYVFPEINGTTAFERIKNPAILQAFATRHQPEQWKIPTAQKVLDWLAVTTILLETGVLGWLLIKRWAII